MIRAASARTARSPVERVMRVLVSAASFSSSSSATSRRARRRDRRESPSTSTVRASTAVSAIHPISRPPYFRSFLRKAATPQPEHSRTMAPEAARDSPGRPSSWLASRMDWPVGRVSTRNWNTVRSAPEM